ncbi:MAG: TIGR00366 family protein [Gammaproteobacteria bacterium]|jgi:uncharacterized ion transporter superfamily protein YfcC|nr:TIGR00366 family protein [Gammaproteobacteria bacterium]
MARTLKVPHTLVLMFIMMIVALALTWVLPAGSFETVTNDQGREVVQPGTFHYIDDADTLMPWHLFTAVPRAMADVQGIIFFVLLIGGALAVIRSTGAIEAFLGSVIRQFGNSAFWLISLGVFLFAAASATLGMAEEYIPLAAILISLCVAMRMDTVAAIGIMVVGYCVGYGAAILNPFTLFIAQDIAELQPGSGIGYRAFIFWPFLFVGIHHVWSYARKVQNDPEASLVHGIESAQPPEETELPEMTGRRKAILGATGVALAVLVFGIVEHGWYLVELGAMFIALAIVVALIDRMAFDDLAKTFSFGASELAGTAILIGFAKSIALILEDGQVLHTIVNGMAAPLIDLPAELSAVGMLGIQSVMNIFVSSGSGQAYLTMPLMAPIGDLVGITRQVSVLAYQFGDGFMNMIVPTNPVLMGILGLAGIPYDRWFRFIFPLILKLLALAAVFMVVAVQIGYS